MNEICFYCVVSPDPMFDSLFWKLEFIPFVAAVA